MAGESLKINGKKHRPPVHRPDRTSLSFTEEMSGTCTAVARHGLFAAPGQGQPQPMAFRLTITADDVERFLNEPEHTARAEAWDRCRQYRGRRHVQRGWFNLFAPDDAPDRRLMRYRLQFADAAGQPRTVTGVKDIFHGPPSRIWPGHLDPAHQAARRPRGRRRGRRRPRPGHRHPAPAPDRLRPAAHHVPHQGPARRSPHSSYLADSSPAQLWHVYGPQPTEA